MALITESQVVLDLTAPDRHAATRTLAETLVTTGRSTDLEAFLEDVRAREEVMATGCPAASVSRTHAAPRSPSRRSSSVARPRASTGAPRTARRP